MTGDGWRQTVIDQVTARAAEASARSRGASGAQRMTRIASSLPAHAILVRAAKLRGISIGGYMRRAAMAQAAADLGLDQREVFELDSGIAVAGIRGGVKDLDGEIFGHWGCQHGDH